MRTLQEQLHGLNREFIRCLGSLNPGLKEDVWAQGVVCTGRTTITGKLHLVE